jgi:hypothetical protein
MKYLRETMTDNTWAKVWGHISSELAVIAQVDDNKAQAASFQITTAMMADAYKGLYESSQAFFVSADMCKLLEHSAKVLDSTDQCDMSIAPADKGFCLFETPIAVGKNKIAHGLVWNKSSLHGEGVALNCMFVTNPQRDMDLIAEALINRTGRYAGLPEQVLPYVRQWQIRSFCTYLDGQPITPFRSMSSEDLLSGAVPMESSEELAKLMLNREEEISGVTSTMAIVHALFLMLGQTIVDTETKHEAGKKLKSRMIASKMPSEVVIVKLRHVKQDQEPGVAGSAGTPVEWTHRWMVNGFWRWQPYKNAAGETVRKRIWIDPYVKGPADKPLILKDRVMALVR